MWYSIEYDYVYEGEMRVGDREATNEEIIAHEKKYNLLSELNEARKYLQDTQIMIASDYFSSLSEINQKELTLKRQEAINLLKANENV